MLASRGYRPFTGAAQLELRTMRTTCLALIALASQSVAQVPSTAPSATTQAARGAEGWTSLPFPSLCRPRAAGLDLARLDAGRHLILPGDELSSAEPSVRPELSSTALLSLLEDESQSLQLPLRFFPSAPPLLARGDSDALAQVRALLGDLDRAGRVFEVDVRAWITEGAAELTSRPSPEVFAKRVGNLPPWDAARVRSGEVAVLGSRREIGFVAGYGIEVATDSGVADPQIGQLLHGRTLHLRACRARGGRAIHLDGFLDLAELKSIERFDTGTADLGIVQEPLLEVVQIAFAGVVESGGRLAVAVRGSPLATSDWTLWIEATATRDPSAASGPEYAGLRALDVALLESSVQSLPLPQPGTGLDKRALWSGEDTEALTEPLSASTLAKAAEVARAPGDRSSERFPLWGPGLLLLSTARNATWSEIDSLVAAAEMRRLAGAELVVTHGALKVALPVAEGISCRVLVGSERTLLVDYDVHVAQQTWMPAPKVEPVLDGVLVQGELREGGLRCSAWIADSELRELLSREEIGMGRLQTLERGIKSVRAELRAGPGREILTAGSAAPGLQLELRAP